MMINHIAGLFFLFNVNYYNTDGRQDAFIDLNMGECDENQDSNLV